MVEKPPSRYKYASLMSSYWQTRIIRAQRHSISGTSLVSDVSMSSSTISNYLGGKIQALTAERDGLLAYKLGLLETWKTICSRQDFETELDAVAKDLYPISKALQAFENSKIFIEQDMKQEIEDEFRHIKRPGDEKPSIDFYERAYANIMEAASKKGKHGFSKHEQAGFRKAVLERYSALKKLLGQDLAWCHVTGYWWTKELVKAAHLVPKMPSENELAFLFGVDAGTRMLNDPKNGLSLHTRIEIALDSGKIAIVPFPTAGYASPAWKCLLVDQSLQDQVACTYGSESILWKDLNGRELQFQAANRPARRYLFFRFLITYLHAKRSGNSEFTSKVDNCEKFWACRDML